MNSKKLITLLVLTTMLLAMVPLAPVSADLSVTIYLENLDKVALGEAGEKGHDIEITSDGGAVASGYEVMVYWDKIQPWDGEKGHLNTTEPDDDGSIEMWFTVPEADVGGHTLWLTATDQETKRSVAFTVIADCDISTSSGLAGSKVITDLWGFAKSKEVAILFVESDQATTQAAYDYDEYNAWTLTDADLYEIDSDTLLIYPDVPLRYDPDDCTNIDLELDSPTAPSGTANWDGAVWGGYGGLITLVFDNGDGTVDITVSATQTIGDMFYATYDVLVDNDESEDVVDEYETGENKYDGTLDNEMLQPGTIVWDIGAGHAAINDVGDTKMNGNLWWDAGGPDWKDVGNINYITGEWSLDLDAVTGLLNGDDMDVDYKTIENYDNHIYILTSSGVTNSLGTYENKRVTIPSPLIEGQYYVVGLDGKNNRANDDFEIGAVINLGEDEADVGDKIEVTGEGFPGSVTLTCEIWRNNLPVLDVHIVGSGDDDDETDGTGDFSFDIIVPGVSKKDDDYEIKVLHATSGTEAAADLEITGLATVSVDPDFGPQGSAITVSGENFPNIKDELVKIEIIGITTATVEAEVKLESDGSFEVDTVVPTENDGTYDLTVTALDHDDDGAYDIVDDIEFRIGTIMVLLSKDESVVGDRIVLTGNGFTTTGEWNATFGDITIFEEENCAAGLLKVGSDTPQFFVPQVEQGVYTITVWDVEAEIMVETEFEVTEYTVLDFELVDAPNEFNVSISGYNWPELLVGFNEEAEIKYVLWNDTDEWDMEVLKYGPHVVPDPGPPPVKNPDDRDRDPAELNSTGFLNDAWWLVPDDETLDKGSYWINATIETENEQEYFMQLEFVVGDIHSAISPRKATFRLGDTVTFNIQHTFGNDANQQIKSGDLKIYDPDDALYWAGDDLDTWSKVETWYEVPYSAQTASGNPMLLLDDAPLGTWTYKWREKDGDVIKEGTFNVEASAADIIGEQIEDLNSAIDDLTGDISSVTDAVAGVQSNINSAIQAANAAVDAANAATEAVNAVAAQAGDAATAAQQAAEAAADAKDAAGGLTTLVYGAIGASLVAALAAIVSLMQISRRIAG